MNSCYAAETPKRRDPWIQINVNTD